MRTVHVATGTPYDVRIARGLMADAGAVLLEVLGKPCSVAILTDDTVDALYGGAVAASLTSSGFRVCKYAMPHGERHKTLPVWAGMLEFLAENRLTRSDCVVALGGGVVGDMAGFAAASYLRGIRFMQIPTTLLAMVDSSVGGKTGLNLSAGKNLAGAFHQPCVVLCDPDALQTLSPEIYADGVAECVKYGVLGDEALFHLLASGDWREQTEAVIETCVRAKALLVAEDERESGARRLLNLGHTLGHSIEKCSDYAISHGHAVAVGMVYASRLAAWRGLCGADVEARLCAALTRNALPVSAPYTAEQLCDAALSDKKREGGSITLVLPHSIGACGLHPVPVAELPEWVALAVNP